MSISKDQLEGYVSDLFSNFFYYNRKGDEEFTMEIADKLSDICTKQEFIKMCLKQINENYR